MKTIEFKEYLEIADSKTISKIKDVYQIVDKKIEFWAEDIDEYDFFMENRKAFHILEYYEIISISYDIDEDDYEIKTIISPMEAMEVSNMLNEYDSDDMIYY